MNLLLASQSPRRRELLALLGLPFETTVTDVDEEPRAGESPAALVTRLSQAKARAAAAHANAAIVACDTVVALDGEILGKPRDEDEATAMLRRLRGRPHVVYSGIALLETPTGREATMVSETQLAMRAYSDAEIAAYVASGDPLDKAGAYAIQHRDFSPVERVEGCYASVMGLPLCHLVRALRRLGLTPPTDVPRACQEFTGHACSLAEEILAP